MSYFIDAPDNSIISQSGSAISEAGSYERGLFFSTDCFGDIGEYQSSVAGRGGTGLGFTPATFTPRVPSGFDAADIINHPGILYCEASTAGTGYGSSIMNISGNSDTFRVTPTSATKTFKIIFNGGKVLSTPADSYIFRIGAAYIGGNFGFSSGPLPGGFYIEYTDSVNSGNWVYKEAFNITVTTTVNTSVPFLANTWQRLEITTNPNNTVLVTLTPCGTTNTQTLFSGNSTRMTGGGSAVTATASMHVWQVTNSGTNVVGGLIDYASLTINPTGRKL